MARAMAWTIKNVQTSSDEANGKGSKIGYQQANSEARKCSQTNLVKNCYDFSRHELASFGRQT